MSQPNLHSRSISNASGACAHAKLFGTLRMEQSIAMVHVITRAQVTQAFPGGGNISAAVRILDSDDAPTVFSTDNLEKFQNKHQPEHNEIRVPPSPDGIPALQVSEDKVLDAIRSFRAGLCRRHRCYSTSTSPNWSSRAKRRVLVFLLLSPL